MDNYSFTDHFVDSNSGIPNYNQSPEVISIYESVITDIKAGSTVYSQLPHTVKQPPKVLQVLKRLNPINFFKNNG